MYAKKTSLTQCKVSCLSHTHETTPLFDNPLAFPQGMPSDQAPDDHAIHSSDQNASSSHALLLAGLREQIACMAEFSLLAFGTDDVNISSDVVALASFCRSSPSVSLFDLQKKLVLFNHRLAFVAKDQSDIRKALLDMLHLVFENISELTMDDTWLYGQVELLMDASKPPLSLLRLDDVHRRIKDVILKQSDIKRHTHLAQDEMRQLLTTFLEKLSSMADLSSTHHRRIEQCAEQVGSAKDLTSIAPAITEAIAATRALSLDALHARDDLSLLKQKAEHFSSEVERLRRELDAVSIQARHDPLTGALNRKGFEEAIECEVSRVRRHGGSLSLAMLDIDDFKLVNDIYGHPVGDAALSHLAKVIRKALRPQDTLSRFGGEEFVILMPDTVLEGSIQAITRLQQELMNHLFTTGSHHLIMTFSAGVAQLREGETAISAISRADQGMYHAKKSGKNKVVAA